MEVESPKTGIDNLPDEILLFIFSRFVDPTALYRISHVCGRWRRLSAHRFLAPNRVQIMTSLSSSSSSLATSSLNSPLGRGSFSSKHSALPVLSNTASSPILLLSSSAPSSATFLSSPSNSPITISNRVRSPSTSYSSSPLRSSSSVFLFSPNDFKVTLEPSSLPKRTFIAALPQDKEVVDTYKLQLGADSEVVCKSCLMLQPLLSKSEKREYGSSIRNKPPRTLAFRIQILKFQVLKFSEDSVHCGCYFVEKSNPKRQLYCRFSCVTGLNSVECEIGKECGAKVIGGDDDDDDVGQMRPWDKISLAITSIDLQGEDVCEVVFCLLDDRERVKRIQKEIQVEAANAEREATRSTVQQTQTPGDEIDFRELSIVGQENIPPVPTITTITNGEGVPRKFTLQNFLRELLFPRRATAPAEADATTTMEAAAPPNRKIPTIVISPSSPLPMQVNSIQSPGVCYSSVNTKCCVLPFLSSN